MIRCWEAMSSLGILRSTPLFCVAAERGVAPQWSVRVQISPIFQHGNFESCTRYRIDIYVSPLDSFRRIFVLPRSLVFLFEHLDLDSFIKDDIVFKRPIYTKRVHTATRPLHRLTQPTLEN